jgi:hypothetical protein
MPSIATIILDDTATLTAADWDYDPSVGIGDMSDAIEAPEGFTSDSFTFDPYI